MESRRLDKVTAGEYLRFDLVYTVGAHGLARGGAIKFNLCNEVLECNRRSQLKRRFPEKDWSRLQSEDRRREGHVGVTCSRRGARFTLHHPDSQSALDGRNVFSVTAALTRGGPLQLGDRVILSFGRNKNSPGVRAQLLSQRNFPIKMYFDLSGNGIFLPLRRFPTVNIVGRPAQNLLLHCPPTPVPGERFRLVIVATDYYGNIADGYRGQVAFLAPVTVTGLPQTYRFKASDRGVKEFDVSIPAKGIYTIHARDTNNSSLNGTSNLIVTDGSFGSEKIYFGDIHTHTQISDGRLHPFDKYREVALHRGCDFWVITDHCHDTTPERLALHNQTLERFYSEGRFVTLFGYEWTGSAGFGEAWVRKHYGHRNVILREPQEVMMDALNPRSDTPRKLRHVLRKRGKDFILVMHFHCGDPQIIPAVDENVEISGWSGDAVREHSISGGKFEGGGVFDLLAQGYHGGVFAGSDHGTEAYYTGEPAEFTAVRCKALTRDAVFETIKDGRGYASSGQKVLLKFTVNGMEPSNSAKPVQAKQHRIEIVVGADTPIQGIDLLRNGKIVKQYGKTAPGVQSFSHVFETVSMQSGCYHVRVRTAQGHYTWSSPVRFRQLRG